jgi:hypothetical protein
MSDQTVWVACGTATTNPTCYHTDQDCSQLHLAPGSKPVSLDSLGGHYRECMTCSGEQEHYGGHNSEYYEQALAADPDRLDG